MKGPTPRKRKPNRPGGIRWHLFQVQLISMVPIGLLAAALLYLHWQAQEHERERAQIESVRLLAAAVDNALDSTVERLSILARLWASTDISDRAFFGQARQALAANSDWADLLAFAPDGTAVFRADTPPGEPMLGSEHLPLWRPVFEEAKPVVSDIFEGPKPGSKLVSVGVPVVRDGKVQDVLIANIDPAWYDRLLREQGLPPGGVAALVDRNFKFIARSSEGDARRGGDPTAAFIADMKIKREGLGRYTNLNGTNVYTAWTFTRHGWGVGLGTPSAPVDNAFWAHLVVFGFLWIAAVAAGMVYASAKARAVAAAFESLETQTSRIATGGRVAGLPASHVYEVDSALRALERASELLQSTMRERDHSLQVEREARAAAEAANRAKDEFLAMLGHELRNPLAAISNAATIVRSDRSTAAQIEFAGGVVARQSEHLKRLIDDLLDVGRAMTDKIVLEREPVELGATARHVVATLRTAGRLAKRVVEVDAPEVWIEADRTRTEQIVTNLIANAARHTDDGGRITVRTAREGAHAVLEVSDDGGGIAAEDLPHVFELFFQGETTSDRAGGGLGIGLTLVQRLAQLHGGDVVAASAGVGKGATFTVRLPAVAPPIADRPSGAEVRDRRPETVLLVEDNADARESLRIALELEGHRVLECADGQAALELLRREHPGVAVLDIGLPGMDGYELARRIRAKVGGAIRLIALTGYGTERDERRAADAGFDRHLTKPVEVNKLLQLVAQEKRGQSPFSAVAP